ncbi:MAG: diacylglycerol kinase family lipid kinase [Thermodesulfobacteriota bacterium]
MHGNLKEPKYLFIINPAAGQGRTAGLFSTLKSRLEKQGANFDFRITRVPGDAIGFAREGAEWGFTHIISVGGDGTSHEVVKGLMGTSAIFGTIPSGSGNDFPKAAGVPLDPMQALDTLFSGGIRSVDVGKLGDKYFINGLGIGLDGAVSHRFKKLKFFRGQLGYVLGAVQEAMTFEGFVTGVKIGDWEYSGRLLLAGASNGMFQGGKFKLAPEADVGDGLLDFHIIKDMKSLQRLIKIPKVLSGTHAGLEEVELRRGPEMEITVERALPAHMDGEPFYLRPGTHKISILPGALKVMTAPDSD